jgi:hypothetical protein
MFAVLICIQTALQVFNRAYKQALPDNGHPLLRKAEHLENILNAARRETTVAVTKLKETPKCRTCSTEYSPYFHYNDEKDPLLPECHRCCIQAKTHTMGWKKDVKESAKGDTKGGTIMTKEEERFCQTQ